MERRKEHPVEIRRMCVNKWKSDLSKADIGRTLELPVTSVKGIIKRFQRNGYCASAAHTGRPRAAKPITDRLIVREVERDRFASATSLTVQLKESMGVDVQAQTVRNRIIASGMNGRSVRKTLNLTKDHKNK